MELKKSQIHRNREQNGSYQGLEGGGHGEILAKGCKIAIKQISSEDIMYSMVSIVNNIVLYT